MADVALWDDPNRAYEAFSRGRRPARSVVPCGPLQFGARIGIEAMVAIGS
jgi:enamine deaminase RidA (YjgF/YER057c/UK114 family)